MTTKTKQKNGKNVASTSPKLKWHSYDEVFGKATKTKEFRKTYNEEFLKLRLARQMKEIRLSLNLTQKDVAGKTHMPQSVIARIESGEHSISLDTLGKIAHSLGREIQLV